MADNRSRNGRSLLLFSGSNDRAVHAIARTARQCGENYQIIAWGAGDRMLQGQHREAVCAIREGPRLDTDLLRDWIAKARRKAPDDTFVIVPSSEFLNWFLLGLDDAQRRLLGVDIPLVDRALYSRLTNKGSATELLSAAGVRVPRRLQGFIPENLPMVAKPTCNLGSDGRVLYPHLLRTREELDAFLRDEGTEDFFCQQFIQGRSHYLLAYLTSEGEVFSSSQINLAQQPKGKSILLARTNHFSQSPTSQATVDLLRKIGFRGFAMVEFIVDGAGPCFIEVNPRPWGPLQLCADHRCGIIEAFLGEALHDDPWRFRDVWHRKPISARYLWLGGMLQSARSGDSIAWAGSSLTARSLDVARSLGSDVYLRRDSLRVFFNEARNT